MSDSQKLFAERIGGLQFGKVQQTFKFTLIDNAKKDFIRKNPSVKVIDMGVGEPEELPPPSVIETLFREAKDRENRIYPCNGTQEFKEACARYLKRLIGKDFDASTEIVHCIGSKAALAQVPLAFVNPGDTVVATAPGYPVLPKVCTWLGGEVVNLKLTQANKFLPDLAEFENLLKQTPIKMLLLNYPNNPTGAVCSLDFYKRVVALAHQYNFVLIQDAAYADMVHEGEFCSPLQVDGGKDVTLELYSLSKSYNMQGYRLGFVAGGAPLLKAYALVKDNTDNGQFIAIQKAGVHALEACGDFLAANCEKYRRRLTRTVDILRRAGLAAESAPSTFYLYVPVPQEFQGQSFKNAQEFTDFLIAKFGLISVPWEEAGAYVRLSMTFEIGTKDFADEEAVFAALEERLVK